MTLRKIRELGGCPRNYVKEWNDDQIRIEGSLAYKVDVPKILE